MASKKSLCALLTLILTASLVRFPDVHAASPTLTVTSVYNLAEPATTLLINITVSDVSDLSMWVIDLSWDPTMIQITTGDTRGLLKGGVRYDIYEGPFLKSIRSTIFIANDINVEGGNISSLAAGYVSQGATQSGSGILATINFTLIKVGTTTINMTGPSSIQSGQGMLIDHNNKEIPHDDVEGVISDKDPPPPPPIWTQLWFQVILVIVIVAVVAGYLVVKVIVPARARARAKEAEEIAEENVEEDFFKEN